MKSFVICLITGILVFSSCRDKIQEAPLNITSERAKKNEKLIKMNSYVAKRNQELISQFVKRTGLKMKTTGSGLWFEIYKNGDGKQVRQGDIIEISYQLKLLDGTFIDSVSLDNPRSLMAGKAGVESGLEEGIMLLHEGDHALFILPPHLAFGNFGNQDNIPPGAFLLYDLFLSGVKPGS